MTRRPERNSTEPAGGTIPDQALAFLVTSYQTGANVGMNVGVPGYSYDIVVKLFLPLLKRLGPVIEVKRKAKCLQEAVHQVRSMGLQPVHVAFLPIQDVCFSESAPNVVIPAWEYPDVPDHEFDDNPQNNWVTTSRNCSSIVVGGPFTAEAFRRAGIHRPLHVVPVPTPEPYFHLPLWTEKGESVSCQHYSFSRPQPEVGSVDSQREKKGASFQAPGMAGGMRQGLRRLYRSWGRALLPPVIDWQLTGMAKKCQEISRRRLYAARGDGKGGGRPLLPLSGVVYTSIFNPADSRKNWEDMVTGFLYALRDYDDATLVLKLANSSPTWWKKVVEFYTSLHLGHRCKVIVITDHLDDREMVQLAHASTFYLTTTRAEGNCLPVMNFLAAGRPVLSPCHTAISDYFDEEVGFILDSHPEPAAFPHDRRLRKRTTWHRLVWPSLVERLRESYWTAKQGRDTYLAMARRGRERMLPWAGEEAVFTRLRAALQAVQQNTIALRQAS